jgi:hypothetical protein
MKKTKIGHQRTGSVLAMFAGIILLGLTLSSCEKGNDELAKRECQKIYVPSDKIKANGKEFITKGEKLIVAIDEVIAKAEVVKDKATSPEVCEVRNNAETRAELGRACRSLELAWIEWARHLVNGGTASELNQHTSKYEADRTIAKSKIHMADFRPKFKIKDNASLPELAKAIDELNKTLDEYSRVLDEHSKIATEFDDGVKEFSKEWWGSGHNI